tara:strand:- start:784 stop:918 length:135 start_codon:yes stop_codon:yes gene_type:complete
MNDKKVDIFFFDDFEESDLAEAISDLKRFGVNDNELDLEYEDLD